MSRPVEDRFWEKVSIPPDVLTGCWEWQAGTHNLGYGVFAISKGKFRRAHRLAWEFVNGPIPDGLFACHRCDNPPCVNPAHIFLGTNADNHADMDRKGRSRGGSLKGVIHHSAKLNDEKVLEMRRLRREGVAQSDLAKRFGISQQVVSKVVNGKLWRHVPMEAADGQKQ